MGFNIREDNLNVFENIVDICLKNEKLKSAIKASCAAHSQKQTDGRSQLFLPYYFGRRFKRRKE